MITAEKLRELLHYDPETGIFTWKVSRGGFVKAGAIAGSTNTSGHRQIKILRKAYLASRLACLYMNGDWPERLVDHRDRSRATNVWENLRDATFAQNACNRGLMSNNTSGYSGVSWSKSRRKWRATIGHNYKQIFLGYFDSREEAAEAVQEAAVKYHGEFAPSV